MLVLGIVEIIKSFSLKSRVKKIFNGVVKKENVIYPKTDKDLDIEDLDSDNYNRDSFKYYFYNETELSKDLVNTKGNISKQHALNELKTKYREYKKTNY